ncbi:hypothetical protein FE257_012559 [Aspergillus nanangensis]|uniref:Arylsulfatase n=1 Tax=Aspergillus nanangensis TaxID=2582783 RepID=A0AAD4CWM7_ASPNN|nr:hypothetical protein FE257_012559 [Aspergillus nanangensis]
MWLQIVTALVGLALLSLADTTGNPNIVFILTDDQDVRMNSLSHMQHVQDLLIREGTQFLRHYAHAALCCPSRVTLWTGLHAHNHNVTDVVEPYGGWSKVQQVGLHNKYLPVWLSEHGYNTYYAGKLYNGYGEKNYDSDGKYAAGWTESDFLVESKAYTYYDSVFQHNKGDQHDKPRKVTGYSTSIITDATLQYIEDSVTDNTPFFVVAAPIAPHTSITQPPVPHPIPEKKYDGKLSGLKVPDAPNFNPNQRSGVNHIRDLGQITNTSYLDFLDLFHQKRIETLLSVDDLVREVVTKLEDKGILDNTYIIYTSDNGFHIGHHRMAPGKRSPYEEDINVPMIIRGPGVGKGMDTDMVTSHVDLAPTIMNMAGVDPEPEKHKLDGLGLKFPLSNSDEFEQAKNTRGEHVNVELWGPFQQEGRGHPKVEAIQSFKALRIQRDDYDFMYSVWCNQTAHELYDMKSDEYQMTNLYPADGASNTQNILGRPVQQLVNRLDAVILVQKSCRQDQCRSPWKHLHPDGQVHNLKQALDVKFDEQYAQYPKVKYDECFMSTLYDPAAEGPQWDDVEASRLLMRDGLPWDAWA